jgi:cysteinyl-tRNA synthetase
MLTLYNTRTRKKEPFTPLDANNVRMYVCGPTVYARPHLGNARSVVVYDVLYRLLRHLYGAEHVTYVRNITDVDDKINAASIERGSSIQALTREVTAQFHEDMEALNCLRPTHEPRATDYIPQMIAMIEKLIANGNAYVAEGHVLFSVESGVQGSESSWVYGQLSGRTVEKQQAGARVAVEGYKRHAGDFVLWKPADAEDDASSVFDSPWGRGRPGWHIECSAMSTDLLGATFDLHGGGADLKFPHHENEIAQACCAHPGSEFARTWVHNGFLTVDGEKMSKSLGNFITVRDVLDGNPLPLREGAGEGVVPASSPPTQPSPARGEGYHGEVIRLALLMAKYNEPLNWTKKLVEDAEKMLDTWYRHLSCHAREGGHLKIPDSAGMAAFVNALCDDLNVPQAFSIMHRATPPELAQMASLLGLCVMSTDAWFKGEASSQNKFIESHIAARAAAKAAKNWAEADRIRDALKARGIILEDRPDGTTDWRRG